MSLLDPITPAKVSFILKLRKYLGCFSRENYPPLTVRGKPSDEESN